MSDIVERLTGPDYWISGNADGSEGHNSAPFDAAIEIKRLREVIDQLQLGQGQDECHWQESKGGRLG